MRNSTKHLEVLAALGLKEGSGSLTALIPYLSDAQGLVVKKIQDTVAQENPDNILKAFCAQESFSRIAMVHPAWILELLKNESPRVIGVLLRYLPSRHVRYLLEHLPKQTVALMPKIIEAFYVPGDLLEFLRKRLESRFVPVPLPPTGPFSFEQLFFLKVEEIELLLRELGLSELALALIGTSKKVLKPVLNRFTINEAKDLVARMKDFESESPWFFLDARYSILELGNEELGIDRFLTEIGVVALAKAFTMSEETTFELFKQKMSPERAYLLKRYIEECGSENDVEKTERRKNWVLKHVERLKEQNKIEWTKREAA